MIEMSFIQILSGVDKLKAHLDEEFKKENNEVCSFRNDNSANIKKIKSRSNRKK